MSNKKGKIIVNVLPEVEKEITPAEEEKELIIETTIPITTEVETPKPARIKPIVSF